VTEDATRGASLACRAVLLATISIATVFALVRSGPPAPADETTPDSEFSAARALTHLRAIARAPRPVGSQGHGRARRYIFHALRSLGLDPSIQAAAAHADRVPGGRVQNVVAVLPGRDPGRGPALLLTSHYDSVAAGPGAGDAGAPVAALLETVRALRSGPALASDVAFLFTDAEEIDLGGARAFAAEHPLAERAAVALNFEARGSRGPVYMFETSRDNGWLIDQLAASGAPIAASSLAGEIYRRMPHDSDFSVFRAKGISGMNFAFIGGLRHYHTAQDTIENLDPGSLQHHGSLMLALGRRLGDADLSATRASDAIYFDLGGLFVHYDQAWVLPLLTLAAAAYLGALLHGLRRRLIRWQRALAGLGLLLAAVLAVVLTLTGAARAVMSLDPRFTPVSERRAFYDPGLYMIAFAALAATIAVLLHAFAARRVRPAELAAGALAGWLVLAAATAFAMPGASYLFTWPLLFATIGLWALLLAHRSGVGARATAALALSAIPSLLILAPTIDGVYSAMSIPMSGPVLALLALTAGLLAAPLAVALGPTRPRF
jgi:Peptidase family M28